MIEGPSVDRHHWIPRKEGGGDWSWLHRICHKKLHSLFDEKTLAVRFGDAAALRADPDVASFVKWVRKRPPDYIGRHAKPRDRR